MAAGDHVAGRMVNAGRRVARGPEVHADVEFWRWFVDKGVHARDGVLSAPMYHLLERPAQRTLFSEPSKTTVGDIVSKLVFTGAVISQPRNSHGFEARVSPCAA